MDANLACRLAHASRLAYAVPETGPDFKPYPELAGDLAAVGLSPANCTFFCGGKDKIDACYYGVNMNNEAILAFRGTQPPTLIFQDPDVFFKVVVEDWLNDADAAPVSGADLPGKVHNGFLQSLDALWPDLIKFLQQPTRDKTKPLYVTGHSKGGGLAFLAAYRLWKNGFEPAAVYTFAAPRVGDAGFVAMFDDKLKSKTSRLEYQDDIVPHLPPHTAAWTFFLKGMKLANFKLPIAIPRFDTQFGGLIEQIEKLKAEGLANYASAGTLVFVNWDNPPSGEPDSPDLNTQREIHLAKKILTAQAVDIITDHFLDRGYMPFVCGS